MEPQSLEQQQIKQPNKKGVFVDYETIDDIQTRIDLGIVTSIIAILTATITFSLIKSVLIHTLLLIVIFAIAFNLVFLAPSSDSLSALKPKKVKKIIKITTIYTDGKSMEREIRYNYR